MDVTCEPHLSWGRPKAAGAADFRLKARKLGLQVGHAAFGCALSPAALAEERLWC